MDDRPIGVFDSGIGGLTVAAEIFRQLPGERVVYFGDMARAPYGTKSPETIRRFALEDCAFLLRHRVKAIVVACNTASSVSLDAISEKYPLPLVGGKYINLSDHARYVHIREQLDLPLIGVIRPGAKTAVQRTHSGKVGVIGTVGTIRSGAYQQALFALDDRVEIHVRPCPLFVPLAEEGWEDKEATFLIAEEYLRPLKEADVDVLVLGCTHYPLLKRTIGNVMGPGVGLTDSAEETAREIASVLKDRGLLNPSHAEPEHEFYVSDLPVQFRKMGERFLGRRLERVSRISLDEEME
ncbi:MAG: glutamate racemase [Candidatus Latescibacteria bacterium]|nr:glutamate racemase [Candidatus Latescibacterota bacterium]